MSDKSPCTLYIEYTDGRTITKKFDYACLAHAYARDEGDHVESYEVFYEAGTEHP